MTREARIAELRAQAAENRASYERRREFNQADIEILAADAAALNRIELVYKTTSAAPEPEPPAPDDGEADDATVDLMGMVLVQARREMRKAIAEAELRVERTLMERHQVELAELRGRIDMLVTLLTKGGADVVPMMKKTTRDVAI
jgi:hypothetical protein